MRSQVKEFFSSLLLALAFAFLFQTTAFATFFIPSESMVPTLEVGDRLTASKFAYGWSRFSLPFGLTLPASLGGRVLAQSPTRGDIIVFIHPKSGERMIKRLIGVPGDRVAIKGGRLWLNGQRCRASSSAPTNIVINTGRWWRSPNTRRCCRADRSTRSSSARGPSTGQTWRKSSFRRDATS